MTTLETAASVTPVEKEEGVTPTRAVLERHRQVWARKAVLRAVYHGYFRDMLARISDLRPTVELGSGPGFLKAFAPEIISTDVEPLPWIDRVVDGCRLPFEPDSVGNIVMMDVFHHLPRPFVFLREALRVLRTGGRIVMLEPWTSALGYPFYRYVHHEGADRRVDPVSPFGDDKDAMDGNAALPRLVFERFNERYANGHKLASPISSRSCEHEQSGGATALRLTSLERLPALSYLLTGGFKRVCLLPRPLLPLMRCVDQLVQPFADLIALRALIVLEKQTSRP